MRITRKIRRAWLRGKPEWAKCYLLKQRLRKQNKVKSLEEHKNKLHGYSRYLVAGVVLACLGMGQATQAYASNITVKDNNYAGTVETTGNVINVYNQQVNNGSALNKFTNFELSQSDIANMHLDAHNGVAAADRQINLVDNKVSIDGVLNAYKNGQIGGDIYFFSDKGIAIGSTGVVNVGSLTLGTSVSAGQNVYDDFTSYNNKSSLEKAKYIAGEGDISIGGSINATDNITIGAKNITVNGDAKINSGVDFSNVSTTKASSQTMEDYRAQFMNMGGVNESALTVKANGDEIVLCGQSGVEFSSSDYISITGTSPNNVKVASDGGDVEVRVNASDNVNAEVSIKNAELTTNGGDINVSINNSARDDIKIAIENSTLDATSDTDNANGNVSISASTVAETLSWAMYGSSTTIDITESNVKGDNVNVSAVATLSGEIDGEKENTATDEEYLAALDTEIEDEQSIIDWVYDISGYDVSELRSLIAVTVVEADSQINITDSTLEAVGGTKENKNNQHGNINVNTYADSQIITFGLGFINFGVTLGFSDVVSKVNIIDSNIKAEEDINIDAYGKNKIDLDYLELAFLSAKVPATVVFNMADMNSDVGAYIDCASVLRAERDVSIASESVRSLSNTAVAGGEASYAGVAVTLSMSDTKAVSDVRGSIYANGDVSVSALNTVYKETGDDTFYEPDTTSALSFSGDSYLGKSVGGIFKRNANPILDKVLGFKGFRLSAIPGKSDEFGINSATAVLITDSEAKASVTGNVSGFSGENSYANSLDVNAETFTRVSLGAMTYQNARSDSYGNEYFSKDYGVALGVNVGIVENKAEAIVGGNIKVSDDVNIKAKTSIPWETTWSDDSITAIGGDILTLLTSRTFGLDKLVDSWAQSNNSTDKVGGAGAVTYLDYTNDADAYVAGKANITVGDEIHIEAINDITSVNFSGIVSTIFHKWPIAVAWENKSSVFKENIGIWGTSSEYATLGGAVAVVHHENDADAYVADGATISTKSLDVEATNQVVDVVIAGNGGKSETVSVDAAVGVINTQNSINAYIGRANVTASDDVNIDALDKNFTLNLGGTIVESGSVGIGATVAYNYLERDTNAFINGYVNSGDGVSISAKNTGDIVSATIAGSITCNANVNNVAGSKVMVPTNDSGTDVAGVEDSISDMLTGAENNADRVTSKTGFGASANVAFNDVTDNASAYVATLENATQSGTENTKASVNAKTLSINSINDSDIVSVALTASVNTKAGASTGIAGSYMQNSIISNNKAYLDDAIVIVSGTTSSNEDDALQIEAANEENIINISVGGSVAPKGNNVLGQVSNNILESNTQAYINDSTVKNDDTTTVKAYDDQDILLVSGAVTVSGSYIGVGAAVGVQQITADTSAFVKDSEFNGFSDTSTKGGDLNVVAEEKTDAFAIVATGSFGGSNAFASADSSGTNIVDTKTKAYIDNSINLNAANINVAAQNIANSTLGVGGISQSNNAVGVSLANNLSTNVVEAYVKGDANKVNAITADSLNISATNIYNGSADEKTDDSTTENAEASSNTVATTESTGDANDDTLDSYEEVLDYLFTNDYDDATAKTVAFGAAIANNTLAGVGSEVLNQITNTTKAHLDEGKYSVVGGLNVDAQSEAYIFGLAGGLSAAKNVGIGASVDYEDINITTEAYVGDKVNIDEAGSIIVKAESIEDITSIAVSAGGGKYFAGAFNAGIHDIHIDTNAHMGSENIADSNESNVGTTDDNGKSTVGKITIEANDNAKLSANAGGGSLQISGTGVASSLGAAVEVLEKNVNAYIGKANVFASAVDIDAINQGEIITTANELAIAASSGVGLSGAASENFVTQNTKAYVADGSQITIIGNKVDTVEDSISIKAYGNFKSIPEVVGAAVGSYAAGGVTHAYMDFEGNTFAYVGDGVTIEAGEKLEIIAENDLGVTVGAGAGAGSKYVSGNGAIGLVDVDNSTHAWIGKQSIITAQENGITVKADDHTKVETYNETLGGSQYASVGAAVQVNNISKDTQAYVKEAAILNSKGNIVINAENSEDLFNNATQADGAQYAAAGASVIVNDLELVTKAFTDTGVQINVQNYSDGDTTNDNSNVTINAHHLLDNDNVAVGVAGSQYGNLSAAVDVTTVSSHVNAYLGDGNIVKGKGNLNVVANEQLGTENDHMISTAVGASGAEFGSGNGSVSVGTFNSAMSDDTQELLNSLGGTSFNDWVSKNVQDATNVSEALDEYEDNAAVSAVESKVDSTKYQYDITGAPSTSGSGGVLAKIGQSANVIANSINVDADDNLYYEADVGSGSAAAVAAGAAIAVIESDTTTKALVDDGADLQVESAVIVDGKINHNLVDATVVGANVSVGGGVDTILKLVDNSDVSAIFKANEVKADSLLVHSDDVIRLEDAVLTGASVNGLGVNGVKLEVNIGGTSTAEINRDKDVDVSTIETTGLTKVFADANVDMDAKVIAPTVGLIAGAGTGTYLSSGVSVKANVYNADINADQIAVQATTTPKLNALTTADIIGGAAVGLTISEVKIEDDVTVNIGDDVVLNADDAIDILAEFKNPEAGYNAYVEAIAGSGGVLTGAVTSTKIDLNTTTLTQLGKNIQISGKAVDIKAVHTDTNNYYNLSAEASGASGKGSESFTTVESDVDLSIDDGTAITSSETTVIRAENKTIKDWLNAKEDSTVGYKDYNSLSAGASAVDGTGIVNETIIEHTTDVNIGKVTISVNAAPVTDEEQAQGISLDDKTALEVSAYSDVISKDYQYIGSGAAIEAAYIDNTNTATSTTNITIADAAKLNAGDVASAKETTSKATILAGNEAAVDVKGGKIVISASNEADMYSKTYVDVWGAVNYAGSNNDVTFNSIVNTNVAGDLETANGDIVITSGRDIEGNISDIHVTAESDILNGSIIPISTYPKPSSVVNSETYIEIANTAKVLSDGNVYLQSNAGVVDVSGVADTKDWVNEVVGDLGGAVGGQVGYTEKNLNADVKVDGYVETGIHRNQSITIGGTNEVNGKDTAQWITAIEKTAGVGYELISTEEVKHQLSQRLEELRDLRAEYSADSATVAQYDKEITLVEEQMVTLGLGYREADGTFVEYSYNNNATDRYTYLISDDATSLVIKLQENIAECENKITNSTTSEDKAKYESIKRILAGYLDNLNSDIAVAEAFEAQGGTVSEGKFVLNGSEVNSYSTSTETNNGVTSVSYIFSYDAAKSLNSANYANVVQLDDIAIKLGDIVVEADDFYGEGTLNAATNAAVTITNLSPNDLVVNDIKIAGSSTTEGKIYDGGNVTLNGTTVESDNDIIAHNKDSNKIAGFTFADNNNPVVNISSEFNPNHYLASDLGDSTVSTSEKIFVAPTLTIANGAEIYNANGSVTVESDYGDVRNNGTITAATVNIAVNNGDYVQTDLSNRITNIGGNPEDIYADSSKRGTGIFANGNVIITARYVNINSTIQSGKADHNVIIPKDYTLYYLNDNDVVVIDDVTDLSSISNTIYVSSYVLGGSETDLGKNIKDSKIDYITYDAVNGRFVVEELASRGGKIEITGTILNTDSSGNGKIIALDGYGSAQITNNTDVPIELRGLDVGEGNKGTIVLTDLDRETGKVLRKTTYERENNVIVGTVVNYTYDADGNVTRSTTMVEDANVYKPAEDLYYVWQTGQETTTVTEYHYSDTSFAWWWADGEFDDEILKSMDIVSKETNDEYTLEDGTLVSGTPYVNEAAKDTTPTGSDSAYKQYQHEITDYKSDPYDERVETNRVWYTLWLEKEYDHYFKIKEGTTTITQNSLAANHDIAIKFEGSNTGKVDVNGAGADVIINGVIDSGVGAINISGANIIQGDDGFINAQDIKFANVNNIGALENPIITNATKISGLSSNLGDNIFAVKVVDNGTELGAITGFDTVSVNAAKDITQQFNSVITAKRVELESESGGVGTAGQHVVLALDTTGYNSASDKTKYGLNVSADKDIYITNQSGDLYLDSVISGIGDVTLKTNGSILDNNFTDTLDEDLGERLSKYQSTGTLEGTEAASYKQKSLLATKVKSKYNNYQSLKECVDENGNYVLDENVQKVLKEEYNFTDEQISEFAAKKQKEYDELVALGIDTWTQTEVEAYIANLTGSDQSGVASNESIYANTNLQKDDLSADKYLTQEEKAQVLVGSTRTANDLLVTYSPGLVKEVTDTHLSYKKVPNVQGKNITLEANGDIGSKNWYNNIDIQAILAKDYSSWSEIEKAVIAGLAIAEKGDITQNSDNTINIARFDAIDIDATGKVNLDSGRSVFVAGNSLVNIDNVSADKEVRLKFNEAINGNNIAGNEGTVKYGTNVVLESAKGSINGITLVNNTENSFDVVLRAAKDISIAKENSLNIDSIYAENGDVNLNGGSDVKITGAVVGGDLAIDSNGAVTIGEAIVDENLTVNSEASAVITKAKIGRNFAVTSKGDTEITEAIVVGDVQVASEANTNITDGNVTGEVSIESGNATSIDSITSAGLTVTSNEGKTKIDQAEVTDVVVISSGAETEVGFMNAETATLNGKGVTIGEAIVDENLTVNSEASAVITKAKIGRNFAVTSKGDTEITEAIVGENLTVDSEAAAVISEANVGGDFAVASKGDTEIGEAIVVGDVQVGSEANTNITDGNVTGEVSIESGNATSIGNITGEGLTVTSKAGKTVVGNAEVAGEVVISSGAETEVGFIGAETATLNSKGVTIGYAVVDENLTVNSEASAVITKANIGGNFAVASKGNTEITEAIVDGVANIDSASNIVANIIRGGSIAIEAEKEIQLTTIAADGAISIISGKDVIISTKAEVNSLKAEKELLCNKADYTNVFIVGKVNTNDSNFADDVGEAVLHSTNGDISIKANGKVAIDKLETSSAKISVEADRLGIDSVTNLGEAANEISINGANGEVANYVGIGSSDGKELLIADSKVENVIVTTADNAGLQNIALKEKAIIKVGDVIVDVNNGANFSTDVSIGKLFVSGNDITATNALTSVDKTLTINGSHKTPTVESLAETEVKVAENSVEKFRNNIIADDVKEISQNHIDAYGKPKEQHPDIEFADLQSIIGDDAVVSEQMIIVSGDDSKKTVKTVSEIHIGNEDDKENKK